MLTKPELDTNAWGESRYRNIRGAGGGPQVLGEQEKLCILREMGERRGSGCQASRM